MSIIDYFIFSSEDLEQLKQTEHYGKRMVLSPADVVKEYLTNI